MAEPLQPASASEPKDESGWSSVLAMVIPAVLAMSSRALMDFVDFALISSLDDPAPLAAILPAQLVVWIYFVIGMGTISLVTTFASQALGAGKKRECGIYGWQVIYLSLFFSALAIVLSPFVERIIRLFPHDPHVIEEEIAYAGILIYSAGPTIASYGLGFFFNGIHRPWTNMWSTLEANVINAVVCAALIFDWLGTGPMGIRGAAIGTFVAVSFRTVRLVLTLLARSMREEYETHRTWRPSITHMLNVLHLGFPTGLQWFSDVFVWGVFINFLVGRFGTSDQIASNAAWNYMRIAFMPAIGVGIAVTSLVGKALGRRDPAGARIMARKGAHLTLGYLTVLSVAYALMPRQLIQLFSTDPEVMRIGVGIMFCAAVFQLFDGLGIIYLGALRGAGDNYFPTLFSILAHWLILLGVGFLVVTYLAQYGSVGAWVVGSILIIVVSVYFWLRWREGAWEKRKLVGGLDSP